ncbi:hypothetical protein V8C44DRAFT_185176 [Trichoderma aethiopicum]
MANVATPRMCQMRIRMQAPVIDCMMMGNVQACTRFLALADCYTATRLWLVSYVRTTYFVQVNDAIKAHSRAVGSLAGSWRTTVVEDVSSQCRRCLISTAAQYRGPRRLATGPRQTNRGVPTVAYVTHVFRCRLGAVNLGNDKRANRNAATPEPWPGSSMPANSRGEKRSEESRCYASGPLAAISTHSTHSTHNTRQTKLHMLPPCTTKLATPASSSNTALLPFSPCSLARRLLSPQHACDC